MKAFYRTSVSSLLGLALLAATVLPVQAQTVEQMQSQILSLLATLRSLQTQLAQRLGQPGYVPPPPSGPSGQVFWRDLGLGSNGEDVRALQQFLNRQGAFVAASGAGSPGLETVYFGVRTRDALTRWQSQRSLPATGYFDATTRNAVIAASGGGSPVPPPPPPATTTAPGLPASGISLAIAPDTPAAGILISGSVPAARIPVLAFNISAAAGNEVILKQASFRRTGILSDSAIAGAYLIHKNKVIGQYTSLSNGVLGFTALEFRIPAGTVQRLELAIDPSANVPSGNTVGFSLASVAAVRAVFASNADAPVTGTFPIPGNTFTISSVSNPPVATIRVTSSSVPTTVSAGTVNNTVGSWNFDVSGSWVTMRAITFRLIGSAGAASLRNLRLLVNGFQAGQTVSQMEGDGTVTFDLASAAGFLRSGGNSVQVAADITGSAGLSFTLAILNPYDIYAVDSQYNVPVSAQANRGTEITINQGSITITRALDTPSGNITRGQTGVVLARFYAYAANESIRLRFLGFNVRFTGADSSALSSQIRNITLSDDVGNQVGTVISFPPSASSCDPVVSGAAGAGYANGVYSDCFGTSGSPISYTLPPNTARILSLRADIPTTANFGTVTASLSGNTNNLQGTTSGQLGSTAPANGNALNLGSSQLTVAQNASVGQQSFARPASNARLGSYVIVPGSSEDVTLNNIGIQLNAGSAMLANLVLRINGTPFGATQNASAANTTYTFSGSFNIPRNSTAYVDVYADVLAAAVPGTYPSLTTLASCSGTGSVFFTSVHCASTPGQAVNIAN